MPARRHAAVCGALLIALAVPAAADAATFTTPLKPCYVTAGADPQQREGFPIGAEGFTLNSRVDLTIDGQPVLGADGLPIISPTTGQPIGSGLQVNDKAQLIVPGTVPAPSIEAGSRDFTVTLTEQGNPANTVSATAKTTALDVSVKPKRAKPSKRVRFTGSGFTADKPVFAHYVFGGKVKATKRMARKPGLCGTWDVRRPQIPVDKPDPGLWTVQFDQSRRYRNGEKGEVDGVYVRLGINVRLVGG